MNTVYCRALSELSQLFGASFTDLPSGYGARVANAKKGKMTIYHQNVEPGNRAEVAFDVKSLAARLQLTEGATRELLHSLKVTTGRPVRLNEQYRWPRVGFASETDVERVLTALRTKL